MKLTRLFFKPATCNLQPLTFSKRFPAGRALRFNLFARTLQKGFLTVGAGKFT